MTTLLLLLLLLLLFMFKMIIFGWINEKILDDDDGKGTSMIIL